jgi:hypothetical protein
VMRDTITRVARLLAQVRPVIKSGRNTHCKHKAAYAFVADGVADLACMQAHITLQRSQAFFGRCSHAEHVLAVLSHNMLQPIQTAASLICRVRRAPLSAHCASSS